MLSVGQTAILQVVYDFNGQYGSHNNAHFLLQMCTESPESFCHNMYLPMNPLSTRFDRAYSVSTTQPVWY